jgi:hypothetical protein
MASAQLLHTGAPRWFRLLPSYSCPLQNGFTYLGWRSAMLLGALGLGSGIIHLGRSRAGAGASRRKQSQRPKEVLLRRQNQSRGRSSSKRRRGGCEVGRRRLRRTVSSGTDVASPNGARSRRLHDTGRVSQGTVVQVRKPVQVRCWAAAKCKPKLCSGPQRTTVLASSTQRSLAKEAGLAKTAALFAFYADTLATYASTPLSSSCRTCTSWISALPIWPDGRECHGQRHDDAEDAALSQSGRALGAIQPISTTHTHASWALLLVHGSSRLWRHWAQPPPHQMRSWL